MHPILIEFGNISIFTYGFLIALGVFMAYLFASQELNKRFGLPAEKTQMIFIVIIVAAVIGGKFFMIFENPKLYFSDPGRLLDNFGSGFVFYGSLIFAIPSIIYLFKKFKLPVLKAIDVFAFTGCIVHAFGRMGCFMAGCCHGIPTHSFLGVTFNHPKSVADPLHIALHPTQLYSVFLVSGIFFFLLRLRKRQLFDGQIFLTYIILYGLGRIVIEYFRGDLERGYLITGILTNSQFISLITISIAMYFYFQLRNKSFRKPVQ